MSRRTSRPNRSVESTLLILGCWTAVLCVATLWSGVNPFGFMIQFVLNILTAPF